MRVVAGSARGRRLVVPPGDGVRPTTDRVREAIFNALHSLGVVEEVRVLDLFAGSGALGIEALSRGAAHGVFVEQDRTARRALEQNLQVTGLDGQARVVSGSAEQFVASTAETFDLVLLDPPYAYAGWPDLLGALAALVDSDGVVVIESDREVELPAGWRVERAKRYGGTLVAFARPPSNPESR